MVQSTKNKIIKVKNGLIGLIFVMMLFSCRSTKYVPDGKYLLEQWKVVNLEPEHLAHSELNKKNINSYIKQKSNKTILGFKFHLWLYNRSNLKKENWLNRTLRQIGEEPVIWDKDLTEKSNNQISLYLMNKGYYDAKVRDTVYFNRKRAYVDYYIKPGQPYKIGNISYYFEDTSLRQVVLADTLNRLFRRNSYFDVDVLQKERERLESLLKNNGYYRFSKEYVYYEADSSRSKRKIDLVVGIKKFLAHATDTVGSAFHPKYQIQNISVYPDFDPKGNIGAKGEMLFKDTLSYENFKFIYNAPLWIKPQVISQAIFLSPGHLFDQRNSDETYKHLASLRVFKFVNIQYNDLAKDTSNTGNLKPLNCVIQLSPFLPQSYSTEAELTISSGYLGGAANLNYQHKNLFRGAETLDLKLRGAVEAVKQNGLSQLKHATELGTEATIRVPKFLLPFKGEKFVKKYDPKTDISTAYNYQRRPDYTRTLVTLSFGYNWRGYKYVTHIVDPIDVNFVNLPVIDSSFAKSIKGTYLEYSYKNQMIVTTSYSGTFNNQNLKKNNNFIFAKLNLESAGNLLSTVNRIANNPKVDGNYKIFNTRYAQYVRGDLDFRYNQIIDDNNSVVYRGFIGIGIPYGNSTALPFEKKYFSGGANSIRAWHVRSLGPGSYKETEIFSFPNSTGDMKLEANLEYRFKMFWILEGALFLDAGNVWDIKKQADRPGANFEWSRFGREIAIGSGLGMRLNFSYFIFRFDTGLKLRDPLATYPDKWIMGNRGFNHNDLGYNIAIGYPF